MKTRTCQAPKPIQWVRLYLKTDCIILAAKTKKREWGGEHNELHNSLREKNKIYYFLKEGTFFSPWY